MAGASSAVLELECVPIRELTCLLDGDFGVPAALEKHAPMDVIARPKAKTPDMRSLGGLNGKTVERSGSGSCYDLRIESD